MPEPTYEQCLEECPELEKVIHKNMWDYVTGCDKFTQSLMESVWSKNAKKNLKRLYKKHGSLTQSFLGFGRDKALIGVGSGPSLNNNIDHLEEVYKFNARFTLQDQKFIIAVANHQFKPLLKRKIFPHFVFLTDGGSHIYDQLCTDIPKFGQSTILVASIYADHKTLAEWDRQGRLICFTIPSTEEYQEMFKKYTGEDPGPLTVSSGGNVLNNMFFTGLRILHARYFMALGNDLSYPYDPNLDKRRSMFYADGDYSVNIKKGVDEAKDRYVWLGYRMYDNPFQQGEKMIKFEPVSTSRQMFVYKLWIELHVTTWGKTHPDPFIYFNCSENGILGVLAKEYEPRELMDDPNNWYLMDEVIPKRWRTRSFLQSVNQFLEANLICQQRRAIDTGVSPAAGSLLKTDGAGLVVPITNQKANSGATGIIL